MEGEKRVRENRIEHWKIISLYLAVYDVLAINFSYFTGLWLRFDLRYSSIPKDYLSAFLKFAPFYTVFSILVFIALRLYNSLWRFASFSELNRILVSSVITAIFHILGITLIFMRMPMSYYIAGTVFQFCAVTAIRFLYRFINLERSRRNKASNAIHRAMVIGAGSAGQVIVRDLKSSAESDIIPVCVIDDNKNKWGRFMDGVPIVGGRDSIMEAAEKYAVDRILFAIPTASAECKREILNICSETGCTLQSLPGIFQLANGEAHLSHLRSVAVEDLLGRDTIKVNMDEIYRHIKGKRILVTGGGGSIGSELCRQIAEHEPSQLIIFDIYENNAYEIQQELLAKYGEKLNLLVLIGSVRDSRKIENIFETYRPQIVYHAAAHKHVPLMEYSPCEAIKNNVIGTYKTSYYALKYGVERFVLISTDKAVNPTNIMGASKRLCEMVIQTMDAVSRENRFDMLPVLHSHSDKNCKPKSVKISGEKIKIEAVKNKNRTGTQFAAVRFGNVLGSNGSVIPYFKKQIMEGGPVTVTDPEVTRYFMTIPEAVSLVLQAGVYAWGGEIFVFDMGEPVKIDTLARNLIKLSGYKPDVDIKIEYIGLRPGEKLYEEKLMAEEGMKKTDNELIHIGKPVEFDVEEFLSELEKLARAGYDNDKDIVKVVEKLVPTFHPSGDKPKGSASVQKTAAVPKNIQGEKADVWKSKEFQSV
ncbi:MAG: polysaccharide biosynthesis protein [Oscillospiraceae bacterium]|nr:polysaccharide biosynthesis protein [Oscillospiraceae bacterium]